MYLIQIKELCFPYKHSIWDSQEEAVHQREVLIKNGYSENIVSLTYIETKEYKNGHYFI